jgi:Tfp pilus assembly protein PilP
MFSRLIFGVLIFFSFSAIAEEGEKEITIEEFLQKLSTVPDVVTRRDPFVKSPPPFTPIQQQASGDEIIPSAPVLERYPLKDYAIVAVLLGDQYPRALIKLPSKEQGKVLIVREKDKVGNKGGVITRITKEGLVVLQSVRSPLGFVDKSEVTIRIGEGGDAQGGGK